jgi:uncharacterized membrane protein
MTAQVTIDTLHNSFKVFGTFWWMVWNGMLALLPALLAVLFFKREDQPRPAIRNITFAFELLLVLALLPNAPYVATDLIHFLESVRQTDLSLWRLLATQFPVYVGFVLFGLLCYCFTTDRLLYALKMRLGKAWYYVGLFLIPLVSSIGVYLGRVARFNSWDLFADPKAVIKSSQAVTENLRIVKVVLSIWLLLIFVHQVYRVMHDGIRARYRARG